MGMIYLLSAAVIILTILVALIVVELIDAERRNLDYRTSQEDEIRSLKIKLQRHIAAESDDGK